MNKNGHSIPFLSLFLSFEIAIVDNSTSYTVYEQELIHTIASNSYLTTSSETHLYLCFARSLNGNNNNSLRSIPSIAQKKAKGDRRSFVWFTHSLFLFILSFYSLFSQRSFYLNHLKQMQWKKREWNENAFSPIDFGQIGERNEYHSLSCALYVLSLSARVCVCFLRLANWIGSIFDVSKGWGNRWEAIKVYVAQNGNKLTLSTVPKAVGRNADWRSLSPRVRRSFCYWKPLSVAFCLLFKNVVYSYLYTQLFIDIPAKHNHFSLTLSSFSTQTTICLFESHMR